jgi:serine/threonine protein kinase
VSDDLAERSWYVMPVATPIRQALRDDPKPQDVVAAVAEVAGTLESLAVEGVAHRDIKPDNLLRLDDRWVMGDFGLVTYPEKDPRTEHGQSWDQSITWPRRCVKTPTARRPGRQTCGRWGRRCGFC